MAKQQLSGIQIPTLSKLNVDGEFTLDAASGSAGQIMISQGSGNTPVWTSSPNLLTPLLTRVDSASEGGQINFARSSDGAQYWYIDSYGSNSAPSLRFVENATTQIQIDTGGVINLSGALKLRSSGSGVADSAPLYFGSNTLLSVPVVGAEEYDGTFQYFTPNTTSSRAIIPNEYYYSITSDATYTITAGTAQKMFPSMTNGLALMPSAMYQFEVTGMISMAAISPGATGSTTLVLDTAFSTPIAYTNITYDISYATPLSSTSGIGSTLTYAALPAPSGALTQSTKYVSTATAATLVTSIASLTATYAGTTQYAGSIVGFRIRGTVTTSSTGGAKLLPHVKFTNASGGSVGAKLLAGSYVSVKRITNNTSNGSW